MRHQCDFLIWVSAVALYLSEEKMCSFLFITKGFQFGDDCMKYTSILIKLMICKLKIQKNFIDLLYSHSISVEPLNRFSFLRHFLKFLKYVICGTIVNEQSGKYGILLFKVYQIYLYKQIVDILQPLQSLLQPYTILTFKENQNFT